MERRRVKLPKGTRDYLPAEMAVRRMAMDKIEAAFRRHGAVTIDTPVFELRDTLTSKYGEDDQLIYDLADQGGEALSLRYDLTVPFARFVALNGITNVKRYHMGKVYRRDQPQMNRGRYREFFQCDFDVSGSYESMVADAEVIKVLAEILGDLDAGHFVIKLNHRGLLDAVMTIAGVPESKLRTVCSAIDKLDKVPWAEVRQEIEGKGVCRSVADAVGEFVAVHGRPAATIRLLQGMPAVLGNADAGTAIRELEVLFRYLEAMHALEFVEVDLSLARGLDYYTGVIFEAVLTEPDAPVGSIAAGGRYDGLVGMFGRKSIPAVGLSIGLERVCCVLEQRLLKQGRSVREKCTRVFVGSIGKGYQLERMKLCSELWGAGIQAEFGYKADPKMSDNLAAVFDQGIPFLLIFGEQELEAGVVKLKDVHARTEVQLPRSEVVQELKNILNNAIR